MVLRKGMGKIITSTTQNLSILLKVLIELHTSRKMVDLRQRRWWPEVMVDVMWEDDVGGNKEAKLRPALHPLGEVELSLGPFEAKGGIVIGDGGVLGGVKGAEPHSSSLVRVSDFRRPFAPWPLPYPSIIPSPWSQV